MTSNAAQLLGTMLRHLTGVHAGIGHVNQNLGTMAKLAGGAVAAFAGFAAIKGIWGLVEASKDLNHELVKLQTGARLNDEQANSAKLLAFKTSHDTPGTNVAENVKMQRELFGVFGNMDTAQQLLPMVAMGSRATSQFVDKNTDLAQIAIRALELRGHITKDHKVDPTEFAKEFNAMVRSIVASEGLIDPQKLFLFIRQAGPAVRNMSSEQMWGMAPAIMNALGAERSGTAVMSLFTQMIGHVVAGQRVAVAMQDAGMLTPGKWRVGRGGKVSMDKDAVPDQAGFMDHPFTWLHDRLEALRNRKDKSGKPISSDQIIQDIFQFSSRATSARLISDIDANWPIIQNEEARWRRMPDPETIFKEQNAKDLSVNMHNLTEAWKNFAAALGDAGVGPAITILHGLTWALNEMTAIVVAHPGAAQILLGLSASLAVLVAVGGTVLVVTTALGALVGPLRLLAGIAGLDALGGGLSALAVGITRLLGIPALLYFLLKPTSTQTREQENEVLGGEFSKRFPSLITPEQPAEPPGAPVAPWHQWQYPDFGSEIKKPGGPALLGSSDAPVHVIVRNGKDIARGTSNYLADQASKPMSGGNAPDPRLSPLMPGQAGLWAVP